MTHLDMLTLAVRGYVMRIAVTGSTGRLGRQVVEILAATGDHQVVPVSRRPEARAAPGPRLATAVADYADPLARFRSDTLPPADHSGLG